MPIEDIDFGSGSPTTIVDEPVKPTEDGDDGKATPIDNNPPAPTEGDKGGTDGGNKGGTPDGESDNSSTGELEVGSQVEFEGVTYTVAENGDLVDADGKVFKAAADIKAWMDSLDVDDNSEFSIDALQEAIGIEVTDENGKPIEFTNDVDGIKSYVEAVINSKSNDIAQGAINKLYADNPLLQQFVDYVQVNGSPKGFGEIPDRSGIKLDKDNEAQLTYVIKLAASEFGNKSINDAYIKYLKDTGSLYDVAKEQLAALIESDKAYREDIERRAEQARREQIESVTKYWNNVNKVINGRLIAGYKLPDSFVKEVNGQKQTFTPDDFYIYLSRQVEDANGNRITGYQKDLAALSDEDLLNRELLDAWLMFTGGTYKDLIDMAVKEDAVRVLKLKAKSQRSIKPVKPVIKPKNGKVDFNDIEL